MLSCVIQSKQSKSGMALSKELRDKFSKALSNHRTAVKSIIEKWKVFGTTKTMCGSGYPSKLNELLKEMSKRLMATLKEIQDFMAKSVNGIHVIISVLHNYGLHGRVARKKAAPSMAT